MNILILKFPLRPSGRSEEKYLTDLVGQLQGETKFHLLSSCPILLENFRRNHWPAKMSWAGPEPIVLENFAPFLLLSPLLFIKFFIILSYYRLFKRCKILWCLTFTEKLLATLPARLLGYRVIWSEQKLVDLWLGQNPFRLLYKLFSRLVLIITVSQTIKEQLLGLKIKPKNIKVIHNGIDVKGYQFQGSIFQDLAHQQKPNIYNSQFIIGCISELDKDSGAAYLIQAFKIAQEMVKDIQLIIIGHGPERNNLVWLAKKLKIDDRIVFVGWQENPSRWIMGFDVFVLPPIRKEGFGLVLLETMAHAKPIIATTAGSIPEIIEKNKTGILIEPKNPEMMAQAIIKLYHDPDWCETMGANARQRVETKFSLEKMANDYSKIFQPLTK